MIHQFRDKKQISQRKKIIKVIIVLIFFLILAFSGFLPFSKRILNYIGLPIWQLKKVALDSTSDLGYVTKTKSSLLKENERLLEENSNLNIGMIDYQILKDENKKLKELLNVIITPSDFILSGILVKPSYSPYDTLIIDVGEEDGAFYGAKVYVNGNVPIGVIGEVYKKTSLVLLYSNPGNVTTGVIEGLNVNVDIVGRGGGNFEMAIPFELVVPFETRITLPGIESEIIAIVEEEIGEPTDPIKKVILHAPVNIQNQKWVQVKKN
jgi:cell shape-determining protein MreC